MFGDYECIIQFVGDYNDGLCGVEESERGRVALVTGNFNGARVG